MYVCKTSTMLTACSRLVLQSVHLFHDDHELKVESGEHSSWRVCEPNLASLELEGVCLRGVIFVLVPLLLLVLLVLLFSLCACLLFCHGPLCLSLYLNLPLFLHLCHGRPLMLLCVGDGPHMSP